MKKVSRAKSALSFTKFPLAAGWFRLHRHWDNLLAWAEQRAALVRNSLAGIFRAVLPQEPSGSRHRFVPQLDILEARQMLSTSQFALTPVLTDYTSLMTLAYIPSQNSNPVTKFATTGSPMPFTVEAEDSMGHQDTGYGGTVHFTSSDTAAGVVLPANSTLTNGLSVFSATLQTPGNQSITGTDVTTSTITGTTGSFAVRGLVVTSFNTTPSGFAITFNKPFNPSAVVMYSEGSDKDDSMIATTGSQVSVHGSLLMNSPTAPTSITFVKTTTVNSLGTFNPGPTSSTGLLAAGNYTVTLRSYSGSTGGFEDLVGSALDGTDQGTPGNNYIFTFSISTPPTAVGIPDFARGPSNTDAVFLPTTIGNGNTFNLIYTNPYASPNFGTSLPIGTATITFSTASGTLQTNIQNALNALPQIGTDANGVANGVVDVLNDNANGANVAVTFQNPTLVTATNQLLSSTTTGVSISLQNINVANNVANDGIPVALSNGQNVTSGSFTLQYNPAFLNITGAVSKIAGASFTVSTTIINATSATAVISLSSPSSISTSTSAITLGSLQATVPFSATASYGAQQLLHFSAEQLSGTGGVISVTNQDAVQVDAYFGDVNDTGLPFSVAGASDAAAISIVASGLASTINQTIPGFTLFPDLDPVIIGDVSNSGTVTFGDVTLMNQEITSPRSSIPWAPAWITAPVATWNNDPTQGTFVPFGPASVAPNSGDLLLSHALDLNISPAEAVLGGPPALVYNSGTVDVLPVVGAYYQSGINVGVPTTITASLNFNNTNSSYTGAVGFSTAGHHPGDSYVLAFEVPSADIPSTSGYYCLPSRNACHFSWINR
jgi:hypothetical protein